MYLKGSMLILAASLLLCTRLPHQLENTVVIQLEELFQISNNGVGHDWKHFLIIQNQVVRKGEKLQIVLKKRAPLRVEAHSIEEDAKYPDVGENHMDFTYSDLIDINNRKRFEMNVAVMENGGQNAGNLAKWKFIFSINKK